MATLPGALQHSVGTNRHREGESSRGVPVQQQWAAWAMAKAEVSGNDLVPINLPLDCIFYISTNHHSQIQTRQPAVIIPQGSLHNINRLEVHQAVLAQAVLQVVSTEMTNGMLVSTRPRKTLVSWM